MTRRIAGGQTTGLMLLLLLGCYGLAEFIAMAADDVFDFISAADMDDSVHVVAEVAVDVLITVAAVFAAISLITRSHRLAVTTGCLALLGLVTGIIGQIWLAVNISRSYGGMGISYRDTLNSSWPMSGSYILPFLVLIALAGVLCLFGPSRQTLPTYAAASYPVPPLSPATQPRPAAPAPADVMFFVEVDATEYGPYSAEDITAFTQQGRVAPDTRIRPTGGYYEPARNVPGLFAE